MADFLQHIEHAKSNLTFLEHVDKTTINYWDWKVTIAYYVAVHLINAHLHKKCGFTYRTHREVSDAINFDNNTAIGKVDETTYVSYTSLNNLSRRSRYLIHESLDKTRTQQCLTYDKHFAKALRHLENIIAYVEKTHNVKLPKIKIDCIELKGKSLGHFEYEQITSRVST